MVNITYGKRTEKIKLLQTDKDGKLVVLYASNTNEQDSYIQNAKLKDTRFFFIRLSYYSAFDSELESSKENISFVRVDADHINNLIKR